MISLRPYHNDFTTAMYEAARESIGSVSPWMPWLHDEYSLEVAAAWSERQQQSFDEGSAYEFMILDATERYLGGIGVNQIDLANPRGNLGYWVRTSAQNQGVATAATRLLVDWTFSNTPLVRLEVVVSVENAASLRAAEKAGAAREGVLRSRLLLHGRMHDAVMFSFVRGQ